MLQRVLPRFGAFARAVLPGLRELVPTQLTMLIVVSVLSLYRWKVALTYEAEARLLDISGGEVQFWLPAGLVAAVLLRWAPDRIKVPLQVVFHGLTAVLLIASGAEIAFFEFTGTRTDWDALNFLAGDLANVLPVAWSEVRPSEGVAALIGVLLCFAPMAIRIRAERWWGVALALPALGLIAYMLGERAKLRGPLRELQPSLTEALYWDGLDRGGDITLPPDASDVVPRSVARVSDAQPNIVLVLLESVGWSATSFGGTRSTTPNLQRLAEGGLVSDQMYAVVPHTSKALVSTMCGDWPMLRTDIGEARPGGLPDRCLPSLLRDLGYSTGFFQTATDAFESRTELIHRFGFQFFRARSSLVASPNAALFAEVNYFGLEDRAMLRPSVDWAKKQDKPFFAAHLTLATHHDYGTLPGWKYPAIPGVYGRELKYLNNVRYVDDFVNRLVTAYADAGLADNTVFVVIGDHGEAFGEHGRFVHDMVIYDEGLHIPFAMWGPGVPKGVIDGARQQIDVLPTLVQLAGGALSGSVRGASLLSPVPIRALRHSCWRSHRCLAERSPDGRKVIDLYNDGQMQLFDVYADRFEIHNLASTLADKDAERRRLRDWRAAVNGRYDEMESRWVASMQQPDSSPALHSWPSMDLVSCTIGQPWAAPGQSFWVDCKWRPPQEIDASLLVMARFAGVEVSSRPLAGVWPTWKWRPGWTVEDSLPLRVPDDAAAGVLPIEVSWDGNDWFEVGSMEVVPDSVIEAG